MDNVRIAKKIVELASGIMAGTMQGLDVAKSICRIASNIVNDRIRTAAELKKTVLGNPDPDKPFSQTDLLNRIGDGIAASVVKEYFNKISADTNLADTKKEFKLNARDVLVINLLDIDKLKAYFNDAIEDVYSQKLREYQGSDKIRDISKGSFDKEIKDKLDELRYDLFALIIDIAVEAAGSKCLVYSPLFNHDKELLAEKKKKMTDYLWDKYRNYCMNASFTFKDAQEFIKEAQKINQIELTNREKYENTYYTSIDEIDENGMSLNDRLTSNEPPPDKILMHKEDREIFDRTIDELVNRGDVNSEYREALKNYLSGEMSANDVAKVFNTTKMNVSNGTRQLLEQLKELYDKYFNQ